MILFISEPSIIMSLSLTLDFTYLSLLSFPLNLGKGLSTFVSLKNKRILSLLISILYFYIFFLFFIFLIFIYSFLAVLGLYCYAGFSLVMTSGGYSLIVV